MQSSDDGSTNIVKRVVSALCWDGFLPAIAAMLPWFVRAAFPKGHIAEVVVVVLVPMGLALFRVSLANRTLEHHFGLHIPMIRQIELALAIIWLMMVEVLLGLQVFVPEVPLVRIAVAGWVVYFVLILAATSPPPASKLLVSQFPSTQGRTRRST